VSTKDEMIASKSNIKYIYIYEVLCKKTVNLFLFSKEKNFMRYREKVNSLGKIKLLS